MSGYEVDVFLSYSRSAAVEAWVRSHLYPQLKKWLDQSLPHEAKVFIDSDMRPGVRWPDTLRHKLSRSKCLVAVLSPPYFRSDWCLSEWQTMQQRETQLGLGPDSNIGGLIYPIRFWDGQYFPDFAAVRQRRDFVSWNRDTPAFATTRDYDDFVREVQAMAVDLADVIQNAPQWDAAWPVLEVPSVAPPTVPQLRL